MSSITQTINGTAYQIESSPSVPRAELVQDMATAIVSLTARITALEAAAVAAANVTVADALSNFSSSNVEDVLAELYDLATAP